MTSAQWSIRQAQLRDRPALAVARADLWPDATREQHEAELSEMLSATSPNASDILVAESTTEIVGFVEVNLRSHADGCDPRQPVVFIEGWCTSHPPSASAASAAR